MSGRAQGVVKTTIADVMAKGDCEIRDGATSKYNFEITFISVPQKFDLPGTKP